MIKSVEFKGVKAFYSDSGMGDVVVFVHGYLENMQIWSDFTKFFSNEFRVITIDVPGHGSSGSWGEVHSMDDLASLILYIIDREQIDRIFLIGHSMGGYITMAFAELYRERLSGYCLFHSTCYADSEEKKLNRDREISLVKCGKKKQIINVNIPKGFADDNHERLKGEITKARDIALSCDDEGVIALLNGMKLRPDRSHVLAMADVPVLLIGGRKDNYISVEVFDNLVGLAPHARNVKLAESGHMGFIEQPVEAAEVIRAWIEKTGPGFPGPSTN